MSLTRTNTNQQKTCILTDMEKEIFFRIPIGEVIKKFKGGLLLYKSSKFKKKPWISYINGINTNTGNWERHFLNRSFVGGHFVYFQKLVSGLYECMVGDGLIVFDNKTKDFEYLLQPGQHKKDRMAKVIRNYYLYNPVNTLDYCDISRIKHGYQRGFKHNRFNKKQKRLLGMVHMLNGTLEQLGYTPVDKKSIFTDDNEEMYCSKKCGFFDDNSCYCDYHKTFVNPDVVCDMYNG